MKLIQFGMSSRIYSDHHAEQFARALALNDTPYTMQPANPACIAEVNDYLRGMAARGFVPVPETITEIVKRYPVEVSA